MKVSVITPTADRADFLKKTYELLKNQTHLNWEWLVYDTSLHPLHFSDPRICYFHDEAIVTIGEKRNRLIARSTGDVIVHFDDDDYYAPHYLANTVERLKKCSFYTMHAWFSYDLKTGQLYYWDTRDLGDIRYCVNALTGVSVREIDFGPYLNNQKEKLNAKGVKGYGFSFAYTREVARDIPFEDIDFAEDRFFFEEVEKRGYSIATQADERGETVHIIHDTNTSTEFPQYRIPRFLVSPFFDPFFNFIQPPSLVSPS